MKKQWHYANGDETAGPISESELLERLERGEITKDVLVWTEGMNQWESIASIKELSRQPVKNIKSEHDLAKNGAIKKKELNISLIIVVIIGILVVVLGVRYLNSKVVPKDDLSFAKETFERLANGDLSASYDIDWENFRSMGLNIGKRYRSLPDGKERTSFRKGFVEEFSNSFKSNGAKTDQFIDWYIADNRDPSKIVIASMFPNGVFTITVSKENEKRKIVRMEIEQLQGE